ncbi:MAG: TetR/AcrR family transcriptional regulator [Bacteroidetes bacterium]|nr:MAG: TetR/AcrR family transcriptional regulator [Bacteroidota bacterium]
MEQKIIDAYIAYLLENGEQPKSVFTFAKSLDMEESEFYKYFGSFAAIEKHIMGHLFAATKEKLEADEVFKNYGAREKMLALFFSWVENARSYRSYLLHLHQRNKIHTPVPRYLDAIKDDFKAFTQVIIGEGINNNEVADRKYLSDKYADGLWLQFAFIHQFWLKDDSKDFEKTDAVIEKSLHLAFELLGKGVLDAALDFGKFMFQNRSM